MCLKLGSLETEPKTGILVPLNFGDDACKRRRVKEVRCDRESLSKDAVSKRLAPAGPWGEVWRVNGVESWSHLQPQGKGLSFHWLSEG